MSPVTLRDSATPFEFTRPAPSAPSSPAKPAPYLVGWRCGFCEHGNHEHCHTAVLNPKTGQLVVCACACTLRCRRCRYAVTNREDISVEFECLDRNACDGRIEHTARLDAVRRGLVSDRVAAAATEREARARKARAAEQRAAFDAALDEADPDRHHPAHASRLPDPVVRPAPPAPAPKPPTPAPSAPAAAKPKRVRAPHPKGEPRPCTHGCGELTGGGFYRPGHDAKHVRDLEAQVRAGALSLQDAVGVLPSDALKAKLVSRLAPDA